jgi:hypothetical protein
MVGIGNITINSKFSSDTCIKVLEFTIDSTYSP